jgi:ribosomal protein S18 acetylase RimI-like enzyme
MLPLTPSQIPAVAQLLARALADDPAYRFLFPHATKRSPALADFFARNLRTHLPYACTYVRTERAEVVATVTVRPPGGVPVSALTMLRRGLVPFVARNGPRAVKRLLLLKRLYDELEDRIVGSHAHRHVHMMAVAPAMQGRGLGTRLLDEALARSASGEAASLPIALTTHTERNVAFYCRSGFTLTDRRELALGGEVYPVWSMRRG